MMKPGMITWASLCAAGTLTCAATAETAVVTIPIEIPGNSVALQGAKLLSIEVDYEILVADLTSITAVLNKVTRGADLAVATVAAVTLTTPEWDLSTTYYLLQLSCVAPASTTLDFLAAVANFTFRA